MMEAYANKSHHDYEKRVFTGVAQTVLGFAVLIAFWKGFIAAGSLVLGFVIVRISYGCAAACFRITENNAVAWIAGLVKVSLVRLSISALLLGLILGLKKHFIHLQIESIYVILGFIFSVIVYRIRVVLGEVKNV